MRPGISKRRCVRLLVRWTVSKLVSCPPTRFFVIPKMGEIVKKDSQFLQSFSSNLSLSICLSIFHSQFFFHYLPFTFFLLQYFFSNPFTIVFSQSFFQYFFHQNSFTIFLPQSLFHNLSLTISIVNLHFKISAKGETHRCLLAGLLL